MDSCHTIKDRMAKSLVRTLSYGLVTIAVASSIALAFISPEQWTRTIPAGVIIFSTPLLLAAYKAGKYHLGTRIIIGIVIATITVAMVLNGGAQAPAYMLFYPLVAITACVYGAREAIFVTGIAVLLGSLFFYLDSQNLIPVRPAAPLFLLFVIWLCLFVLLLAVAIPSSMLHRIIRDLETSQAEHKQARLAAERANKAKNDFLTNMSHELRTPLNGVMGMLQLIEITDEKNEQLQYADLAKQSCDRLTRLVGDILNLSCIESGKTSILSEDFAMADTIQSIEQVFLPAAKQAGIELAFEIDAHIPKTLQGDTLRLHQVLSNLVGNALKYTETGNITLVASKLPFSPQGGCRILVEVSDTGIGISDALTSSLFEPFVQGENSFTRQFQGAGLGLSIVKRLVTLMGGSVCVESEEQVGTHFYVSLPFGHKEASSMDPIHESDNTSKAGGGGMILLVEDDATNRMATAKYMENKGFEVRSAINGQEALTELKRRSFDCVIMDIQMPVMNGVDATRAIRKGEAGEQKKDTPIIAITAYAMSGDEDRFLQAGMNGYLSKPVEMTALERLVRSHLKGPQQSGLSA